MSRIMDWAIGQDDSDVESPKLDMGDLLMALEAVRSKYVKMGDRQTELGLIDGAIQSVQRDGTQGLALDWNWTMDAVGMNVYPLVVAAVVANLGYDTIEELADVL